MRIVCDNCGAKYQISDDKVRNKVFKIRCKKCSHTIVVRSKPDGAAASGETGDEATRVAPAPGGDAGASTEAAPDAIWYVVVNREQVGPMTPNEVERRYKAGEIDADAFTWAEGMTDWIRLAAVTEFAHMFPEKAPAKAAPVAAPVRAAALSTPAATGGLFPRDEGDDDVMVSGNSAPAAGGADRLFGGSEDDEPEAASPRVDHSHRLRSQRNENSVLFSLDSLTSAADGPRVTNTGGTEGSGLIDISAMLGGGSGGSSSSSSASEAFGGPIGLSPSAPAPLSGGPLPSLVNRKKSNTGLIIGILVGAVIIAGGVVAAVVLSKGDKPVEVAANAAGPAVVSVGGDPARATAAPAQTPVSAAAPATALASTPASGAAPVSVAALAPAGGRPPAGGVAARPAGGTGPRTVAGGRPGGRSEEDEPSAAPARPAQPSPAPPPPEAKPAKKATDDVDDILGSLDGKGSKPAAGGRPANAPPAGGDDPLLPERLDKGKVLAVVRKNAGSISKCKDRDPNASGTVTVSIKIDKSGKVSTATAKGPLAGTPVGNCVESAVRGFVFPQFSDDSQTVNMPFAL